MVKQWNQLLAIQYLLIITVIQHKLSLVHEVNREIWQKNYF